jgi:hypothetical protein
MSGLLNVITAHRVPSAYWMLPGTHCIKQTGTAWISGLSSASFIGNLPFHAERFRLRLATSFGPLFNHP